MLCFLVLNLCESCNSDLMIEVTERAPTPAQVEGPKYCTYQARGGARVAEHSRGVLAACEQELRVVSVSPLVQALRGFIHAPERSSTLISVTAEEYVYVAEARIS